MKTHLLCGFLIAAWGAASAAQNSPPEVAEFRFSQAAQESLPSWITHFHEDGGRFVAEQKAWVMDEGQPAGTGRLVVGLHREQLVSDLALSLVYEEHEAADLNVQLLDRENNVVVVDLFSNVVAWGRDAKTDTFIIPLQRYPEATQVAIRRVAGPVKIYGLVLYPVIGQVGFDYQSHLELARFFADPLHPNSELLAAVKQSLARKADAVSATVGSGSVDLSRIGSAGEGLLLSSDSGQPYVGHQLRKFSVSADGILTPVGADWRSSWLYLYYSEGRPFRLAGEVKLGEQSYVDLPGGFALFVRESDSLHRYEISSRGMRIKRRLWEGAQVEQFAYPFRFSELEAGSWHRFSVEVRTDLISAAFGDQLEFIRGPLDIAGGNKLVLAPGAALRDLRLSFLD